MILRTLVVGPFAVNAYIVGSEETRECLLIDPGAEGQRILEEVASLGLTVRLIVNTHGHGDHTGAVAVVKEATGAPLAIHPADVVLLRAPNYLVRSFQADFRDPPEPDRLLREGDVVEVGDLSFRVMETPGHTPGGICLYGHQVVFTGDTLFHMGIGRYDLPGGDGQQLLHSIHTRLLTLPPETAVYPGHGESTTVAREKLANPFLRQGGLALF